MTYNVLLYGVHYVVQQSFTRYVGYEIAESGPIRTTRQHRSTLLSRLKVALNRTKAPIKLDRFIFGAAVTRRAYGRTCKVTPLESVT